MLDFLLAIGELLSSWRFYICAGVAAFLIWLVYILLPSEAARLAISIPLVLTGVFVGFYWELKAQK